MVLNTETVFFTPYQPLGFRIALFGFADFGLLGRDANIFKNNFYTTFGLGVRLRNERLVFSTIQLRLGVALGKGGWADCRYFQASNGTRMEQYRYLPSRPEIVRFRLILPEEMVEGVGYFQFVYADGETRTFRYASEEQGLWIGEDERCLVDGQAFYDWQERLMEAVQK